MSPATKVLIHVMVLSLTRVLLNGGFMKTHLELMKAYEEWMIEQER